MTINPRILLSGASILAATALGIGATFAFFSDTGTSSSNVFAAGTLDMKLSSDNSTYADSTTASVGGSNLAPEDPFSGDLYIKNIGSVSANHVDLTFSNSITEGAGPGASTAPYYASKLKVTSLDWDSDGNVSTETSVLPSVGACDAASGNGNGYCDLQDLAALGLTNLAFGGPQSTGHKLHVTGSLDTSATNGNQGDSDDLTISVFMDQGPH